MWGGDAFEIRCVGEGVCACVHVYAYGATKGTQAICERSCGLWLCVRRSGSLTRQGARRAAADATRTRPSLGAPSARRRHRLARLQDHERLTLVVAVVWVSITSARPPGAHGCSRHSGTGQQHRVLWPAAPGPTASRPTHLTPRQTRALVSTLCSTRQSPCRTPAPGKQGRVGVGVGVGCEV